MTNFIGGPVDGRILLLKRAPHFLRVVRGAMGFRALDQIEDTAAPDESISVYRVSGPVGENTVLLTPTSSGTYKVATYVHQSPQPDDSLIRETTAWQSWCRNNLPKKP